MAGSAVSKMLTATVHLFSSSTAAAPRLVSMTCSMDCGRQAHRHIATSLLHIFRLPRRPPPPSAARLAGALVRRSAAAVSGAEAAPPPMCYRRADSRALFLSRRPTAQSCGFRSGGTDELLDGSISFDNMKPPTDDSLPCEITGLKLLIRGIVTGTT